MAERRKVTFEGADGEWLAGRLDLPAGTPLATVLFAHCFTCGKDVHAASRIARALTARGFAVLRFDFTGLGESDGEFSNSTFTGNVDDLVRAADHLRETSSAPAVLIGHSLGGAAVLAAASRIPEARAVVTLGAPADPAHVTGLLADHRAEIEEAGVAEVRLAGRPFRVRRSFLDDICEQPQTERIAALDRALLVLHSPVDELVGIDHARRIYEAARHPKSFVALDGADHLLTREEDAAYVADVLAAWVGRYLPARPEPATTGGADRADGAVVVTETGDGRYRQRVRAGSHQLLADEPAPVGDDAGPSPYDLLLAALGACSSMTARMYADRKGWPLESTSVRLRHGRIHAEDCADCETRAGKLDRIERVVTFSGDLDEGQRERLLEIVDRCPVHRTLTTETVVATRLSR